MGRTYYNCPCCNKRVWVDTSWYTLGVGSLFVGALCLNCRNKHGARIINCTGRQAELDEAKMKHEETMKEMELKHKETMKKMELDWLKEKSNAEAQGNKEMMKECNKQISELEQENKKSDTVLENEEKKLMKLMGDENKKEAQVEMTEAKYEDNVAKYFIQLGEINNKLKKAQNQIDAAKKNLSVEEDSILTIIKGLETMEHQQLLMRTGADNVSHHMKEFSTYVSLRLEMLRDSMNQDYPGAPALSLSEHFGKGLSEFVKVLENEGFEDLASLKCDNEAEFNQLCDDLSESLQRKLKIGEKKKLKAACLPAVVDATASAMKPIEKDENFHFVLIMMGKLFDLMDKDLSKTRKELTYFNENNKEKKENKEDNENKEIESKNDESAQSDLSIVAVTSNTKNRRIQMEKEFGAQLQDKSEAAKEMILIFADAAGTAFENLMIAQYLMQREFATTNELMKHKPANMQSNDAVRLWEVVTTGYTNVIERIITLNKRTNEFFSIFTKLKHSCYYYFANQDKPPQLSTKYLVEDLNAFLNLSKQFQKEADETSQASKKCHDDMLAAKLGEQIKKAIKMRDDMEKEKADLESKQNQIDQDHINATAELKIEIAQLRLKQEFSKNKIESLKQKQQRRNDYIADLKQTSMSLLNKSITQQ